MQSPAVPGAINPHTSSIACQSRAVEPVLITLGKRRAPEPSPGLDAVTKGTVRQRVWGGTCCLPVLPGKRLLLKQRLFSGVKIDAALPGVPGTCYGWFWRGSYQDTAGHGGQKGRKMKPLGADHLAEVTTAASAVFEPALLYH